MTLRLTLISPEVEDFAIECKIDADATFADLHRLILKHCNFEELEGQRFFICDDNWKPIQRILLGDEECVDIDEDVYLMHDTELGRFLEDEGQRLTYRFDPENRRMLLLELTETTFGAPTSKDGIVTRRHGTAPQQMLQEEEGTPVQTSIISEELTEEFYGEDGFDEEEIDLDGFNIL